MEKPDVIETVPMLARVMEALLRAVQSRGREGSDVRRAVGDLLANAPYLLRNDIAGEPMALCFDTAAVAIGNDPASGFNRLSEVLATATAENPSTDGAVLTKYSLIKFCIGAMSQVLIDIEFKSRQEANAIRDRLNTTFAVLEEGAADAMNAVTYRALVELHAATVGYLVATARPLPRLIRFHFAKPLPTLVISYRLYDDAGRADELRAENRVVHPAFTRQDGLALSA